MGEEQGGISLATVPLGEGSSGTPKTPCPPLKPGDKGAPTKAAWFGAVWEHPYRAGCSPQPSSAHGRSGSPRVLAAGGCLKPPAREGGKICPWRSRGGSQTPASPRGGGSWVSPWEEAPQCKQGVLTPASARHHFPASHAGARGPAQLCKQDPKPRGHSAGENTLGRQGTGTVGLGPWGTAGSCPRPPWGWLHTWGAAGCRGSGRSCRHLSISPTEKGKWTGSVAGCSPLGMF